MVKEFVPFMIEIDADTASLIKEYQQRAAALLARVNNGETVGMKDFEAVNNFKDRVLARMIVKFNIADPQSQFATLLSRT